ncbi:MAG: NfeD family protein [Gammaproteobacteria bacterium]|nr:MAG: NfeD family protein [Gammaproteobacteria bacterium]
MGDFFTTINHWHWLILAVTLVILEIFVSGFVLFWLGIAAAIVGVCLAIYPGMDWETQVIIFSIFSVVSIVLWFKYGKKQGAEESDRPTLNKRGEQYIGRIFTLNEPIVDGVGKIRVDDSNWRIAGQDTETGGKVRVVSVESTTLNVERAE